MANKKNSKDATEAADHDFAAKVPGGMVQGVMNGPHGSNQRGDICSFPADRAAELEERGLFSPGGLDKQAGAEDTAAAAEAAKAEADAKEKSE